MPTTSSLDLGEIALNTYDGRAFIHKSGSVNTVEQIVVTNSDTTGSINILGTGSFGEISVTNDINVGDSVYVTNDIVGGGDVDVVGAVTASFFVGDGSLLTGIDTSTDAEIPTNDWDYNLPDSGSLSDGNNSSIKYTIDFQAEGYDVRPVGYQTFITNNNGSTEIIPGTESILFIVNNQEVGRIGVEGIVATPSPGTISGSSQITAIGFATTGSNTFYNNQIITGAVDLLGNMHIAGNLSAINLIAGDSSSNFNEIKLVTSDTNFATSLYSTIGIDVDSGGEHSAGLSVSTYTQYGNIPATIIYGGGSGSKATGANDAIYFYDGNIGIVKDTTISGSFLISGSTTITGSLQVKEGITGSIAATNGIISGSSQLPTLATTGSNTFTGLQTFQQIQETVSLKNPLGLGTNNFDFNSGSIFYIAGLTGSGTWNVQNIPSASNAATSLTFVIQQGATAYTASAYQLGGTAVSVKWLDATAPTGSANSTDIIGITVFRSGSVWNVVGSLSRFA